MGICVVPNKDAFVTGIPPPHHSTQSNKSLEPIKRKEVSNQRRCKNEAAVEGNFSSVADGEEQYTLSQIDYECWLSLRL
jgi:hypothetical protein